MTNDEVKLIYYIYHLYRICVEPVNCYLPGPLCTWNESGCTTCFENECDCSRGAGESGLPLLFTMALIVLILFAVIGIFYSILVATMVGQRIWQRHYHILAKMSLTKVSKILMHFTNFTS